MLSPPRSVADGRQDAHQHRRRASTTLRDAFLRAAAAVGALDQPSPRRRSSRPGRRGDRIAPWAKRRREKTMLDAFSPLRRPPVPHSKQMPTSRRSRSPPRMRQRRRAGDNPAPRDQSGRRTSASAASATRIPARPPRNCSSVPRRGRRARRLSLAGMTRSGARGRPGRPARCRPPLDRAVPRLQQCRRPYRTRRGSTERTRCTPPSDCGPELELLASTTTARVGER